MQKRETCNQFLLEIIHFEILENYKSPDNHPAIGVEEGEWRAQLDIQLM